MARSRKPSPSRSAFSLIHPDAAGLDIGAEFHVAAVPANRDEQPVRSFSSFTSDLHRLADWFEAIGIKTVAMESTGVYWIPVFEILEARGFEVLLANAREVKNVPGRKSDVNDAQWLQKLHMYGLLRGSFRPREALASLRAYLRHRDGLLHCAASHIQHMQKALMQMNLQLHHVLSDITGVSGLRIVRAIVAGERDPRALAGLRDERCKASVETTCEALTGNYRAEHVFALQQALELYEVYQAKIAACDVEIEKVLGALNEHRPQPAQMGPRPRRRQKNEPRFEAQRAVATLVGVDLTEIPGIGPDSALRLIGECGDDMSRWPTAQHFTSWLALCPGTKISGGKVLSSRTRPSKNRAAHLFRLAAVNVSRTQTSLGAFFRRLAARIGKAKAVTATARKIAVLFYNLLRYGIAYRERGADAYEQEHRQRVLRNLQRRAQTLGYQLVAGDLAGAGALGVS